MSGPGDLPAQPNQFEQLIAAPRMDLFAQQVFDERLELDGIPQNAILVIGADSLDEQQKLLIGEQRGCAWILMASVSQTCQTIFVVGVNRFGVGRATEPGQGANFSRRTAFGEQGNGLGAALLYGTAAVSVVVPQLSRGVVGGQDQWLFDPLW